MAKQRFTEAEMRRLRREAERQAIREGKAIEDKWREIDNCWIARVLGRKGKSNGKA